MRLLTLTLVIVGCATLLGCENTPINEGEEFRPKEIHENIDYHFDKIRVDGVEYLILSRDNNNPHEGFGFMAFRANQLVQKQDSTMAYLRMMAQLQKEMYAQQFNVPQAEVDQYAESLFERYLSNAPNLRATTGESYSSDPRTTRLTD
ncbi:MAG: hypothetical protein AAGA85_16295 [Bacteroidota bacterium]